MVAGSLLLIGALAFPVTIFMAILGWNMIINLFGLVIFQELRYYGPHLDDLDPDLINNTLSVGMIGVAILVAGLVLRAALPRPGPPPPAS